MAGPDPIKIDSDRLLLCEGKTIKLVLGPLCGGFEIQGFQPLDFGSKDNFRNFLEDVSLLPGFAEKVKTVAIIRDAETNAAAMFKSTCEALSSFGLPFPRAPGEITDGPPAVGIFIVPDNKADGMIETLCLRSVDNDPAFPCLDQFFECVKGRLKELPSNMHKARAQTFLATRKEVDYHVGRAADNGVWPFDHEAFAEVRDFLAKLAN